MSSIVKKVKTYLATCPSIDTNAIFNLQNIDENETTYSVEPIPNERTIKEDVAGNKTIEIQFLFLMQASTASEFDTDDNNEFYEEFVDWLEDNANDNIYPDIGYTVESLKMIDQPYIYKRNSDEVAIYQTQMSIIYRKEA